MGYGIANGSTPVSLTRCHEFVVSQQEKRDVQSLVVDPE